MKEIILSRGKVTLVDDDDFAWLNQWKWSFHNAGYAWRKVYHNGRQATTILMHRAVLNAPFGMDVDHIDGNTLNNCRSNLRIATRAENLRNKRKSKNTTSSFKGVSWNNWTFKWQVYIRHPETHKNKFIGLFDNEIDAAKAYDAKARELFGAFARLNFPHDGEQAA